MNELDCDRNSPVHLCNKTSLKFCASDEEISCPSVALIFSSKTSVRIELPEAQTFGFQRREMFTICVIAI